MPRVSRIKSQAPEAKFKKCIEALVTEPDAACLGGNELCCSGCGGNSDLVDALCAFCLHSDAARRFFVTNGGLEALLVASKSTNEKTVLAAFQVLQCMCCNRVGQQLVIDTQPQLLHQVCHAAVTSDEDQEGLQHAALIMMQQWAEDPDCCIPAWLDKSPPPNLPPPRLMAQPSTSQPQSHGQQQAPQPVLVRVAVTSLQHPVLAIRKAAAHLLASAAAAWCGAAPPADLALTSQPAGTSPMAAAVAYAAEQLAGQALAVIEEEEAAAALPRFDALANGNSHVMLDPLAFFNHQHKINRQKIACHALLHVVSELCTLGPVGLCVLASAPSVASTAAAIFAAAWRVSWAGRLVLPPSLQAMGVGMQTVSLLTAPFSFLQEHQSRELALDTLVLLLMRPAGLLLLSSPVAIKPSQEQAATSMSEDVTEAGRETQALHCLLQLARELLHQPSASHVRAALTVLGHVRFAGSPDTAAGASVDMPAAAATAAVATDVRVLWMQLLCDVFDSAWQTDTQDQAASLSEPPSMSLCSTPPEPTSCSIPRSLLMFPTAGSTGSEAAQPQGQQPTPAGQQQQQGAGLQLELGLGYRVLVQVLQAWKHMLESGCAPVAAALNQTEWKRRVEMAVAHPKQLVASAAARLMLHGQEQPRVPDAADDGPDEAWASLELMGALGLDDVLRNTAAASQPGAGVQGPNSTWGQEAYAAAVAAMGMDQQQGAGPMPGVEEGAGAPIDAAMQEFLNAFLEEDEPCGMDGADDSKAAATAAAAGTSDQQPQGAHQVAGGSASTAQGAAAPGMFASWAMADPSDEEALADALTLIPDLDNLSRNTAACVKYDKVGPFMRM